MTSDLENKLNLAHWKSAEHKFFLIKSDSQHSNAIIEYERLYQTLIQLNSSSDLKQYFEDPSAQNFFFESLLPAAAKAILRSKIKYSSETQDMLDNCLKQMIQLWLNTESDFHHGLHEMAASILDSTQPYYLRYSSVIPLNEDHKTENGTRPKISFFDQFLKSLSLGEATIFDRIYEILFLDKNSLPSVRRMILVCSIVGNLSRILPQDYAQDFIQKLHRALCDYIFQHAASYEGHFTGNNLKALLKAYKIMFRRQLFTDEEKHKAIDELQLKSAKSYLISRNMKTRALGFVILRNIIDDVENPTSNQVKGLSRSICNKFLQDILKEMLGKGSFEKTMLLNSPRVFLYLFKHDLLDCKDYKNFWLTLREITDSKSRAIWGIISNIFRSRHICSLVDCLLSDLLNALDNITLSDIKLIRLIYHGSASRNLIAERVSTFYCRVLLEVDNADDPAIFNLAIEEYHYTMHRNDRLPSMDECFSNLEQDCTKFPFFRVLSFSLGSHGSIEDNRNENQNRVFKLFMQHMKFFREQNLATTNSNKILLNQYTERVECLKAILKGQKPTEPNLSYEMLNEIWKVFTEPPFSTAKHQNLFFQALHQVAETYNGLGLQYGQFVKLFQERILNKETFEYLTKHKEGAAYFKSFFIVANHNIKKIWRVRPIRNGKEGIVVKVVPEELEGYEELWNLILSSQDRKTITKAIEFLVEIYLSLEDQFEPDLALIREKLIARCFEYITSPDCKLKCLEIISKMIEETGKGGIQESDSHAILPKANLIEFTLRCQGPHGRNIPALLKLSMNSNRTVLELLQKIAKELRVEWEAVTLYRYPHSTQEVLNSQNNQTLSEIGIRQYQHLRVKIKPFLPQSDFLRDYDALSLRAIRAFKRFFDEYSDNGKMSVEQYRAFYFAKSNYPQLPNQNLFKITFAIYDPDRDGYLTFNDFERLLAVKAENRDSYELSEFFTKYNLRHDLREEADIDRQQADKKSLVSQIILSNSKHFDTLLSFLNCQDEEIASEAWKLLNRLPTHPQVFKEVVLLKGIREVEDPHSRDWETVISLKSKYKLLYVLNIAEYLINYKENVNKIPHLEELNLQEYQRTWLEDFISYGGLDHLSNIFSSFKLDESLIFTQPFKRIVSFVKAMISKLDALLKSNEEFKTIVSPFMDILSEYENQYRTLEHIVAAKLMSHSIKLLKRKKNKLNNKSHC